MYLYLPLFNVLNVLYVTLLKYFGYKLKATFQIRHMKKKIIFEQLQKKVSMTQLTTMV